MGYKNHKTLAEQVTDIMKEKLRIGQSRHDAKKLGIAKEGIYSWQTYKTYTHDAIAFALWCRKEFKVKKIIDCRQYVDNYLEMIENKGLSAFTIKTYASAIGKLYNEPTTNFRATPTRHRDDIKRSRNGIPDGFSVENNKLLLDICEATGLRRNELKHIRGTDLIYKDNKPYLCITKGSKGGKPRYSPIICNHKLVEGFFKDLGDKKLIDVLKIPKRTPVHDYRAKYAGILYRSEARTIIPKKDRYICRKDKKGRILDRNALITVAKALGHNRITIYPSFYDYE